MGNDGGAILTAHYPVRRTAYVGGLSEGYPVEITGATELVLCGCTNELAHDYGHETKEET